MEPPKVAILKLPFVPPVFRDIDAQLTLRAREETVVVRARERSLILTRLLRLTASSSKSPPAAGRTEMRQCWRPMTWL